MTLCANCEEVALYELSPTIKKVDFIKDNNLLKVLVTATGPIECYKEREIERILKKIRSRLFFVSKRLPTKKTAKLLTSNFKKKFTKPL